MTPSFLHIILDACADPSLADVGSAAIDYLQLLPTRDGIRGKGAGGSGAVDAVVAIVGQVVNAHVAQPQTPFSLRHLFHAATVAAGQQE